MPSSNSSDNVRKRIENLLGKLLDYANHKLDVEESIRENLEVRWEQETEEHKLIVKTKLKVLAEFLFGKSSQESKEYVMLKRDFLLLKDFLEILEDNRVRKQSPGIWDFKLKLWHKEKQKNLEQLRREWEAQKRHNSKSYEPLLALYEPLPSLKSTSKKRSTAFAAYPVNNTSTSKKRSTASAAYTAYPVNNTSTVSTAVILSPPVIKRKKRQLYHFIEDRWGLNLDMVEIPNGTFLMGSPEDEVGRSRNESPQHQLVVESFFMGRYPVTQAQWRIVAQLPKLARDLEENPSHFKEEKRPVENVSWYDAIEFCARLSRYRKQDYRLPSEVEWEYACRAGTKTSFHFGETISTELANYDGTSAYGRGGKGKYQGETTEVGYFRVANNFGLSDMHGNVWEWCADPWHDNYEDAPADSNVWDKNNNRYYKILKYFEDLLNDEALRTLRGGSWRNYPGSCRSACRDLHFPVHLNSDIGFRVVCSSPRNLP